MADGTVVTVGTFHAGTKQNIIPDSARLVGTIRTFDDGVQADIHARVRKIAEGALVEIESRLRFLLDVGLEYLTLARSGPSWSTMRTLSTTSGRTPGTVGPGKYSVAQKAIHHAFALVPKLRGDARERLRHVLRGWGLHDESRSLAASRSVVRRCRG